MEKTYHGSCHCGAVAFEADLDLEKGAQRCNCSYCRKSRNWSARTTPDHFRLSKGADQVARHDRSGQGFIVHCFCGKCGIRLFSEGNIPEMGGAFVSVQLSALDDASEAELIEAPLVWCDGLNDNWWNAPAEVRHL